MVCLKWRHLVNAYEVTATGGGWCDCLAPFVLAAYARAKPCCCCPAWQYRSCHCCPAWQAVVVIIVGWAVCLNLNKRRLLLLLLLWPTFRILIISASECAKFHSYSNCLDKWQRHESIHTLEYVFFEFPSSHLCCHLPPCLHRYTSARQANALSSSFHCRYRQFRQTDAKAELSTVMPSWKHRQPSYADVVRNCRCLI